MYRRDVTTDVYLSNYLHLVHKPSIVVFHHDIILPTDDYASTTLHEQWLKRIYPPSIICINQGLRYKLIFIYNYNGGIVSKS